MQSRVYSHLLSTDAGIAESFRELRCKNPRILRRTSRRLTPDVQSATVWILWSGFCEALQNFLINIQLPTTASNRAQQWTGTLLLDSAVLTALCSTPTLWLCICLLFLLQPAKACTASLLHCYIPGSRLLLYRFLLLGLSLTWYSFALYFSHPLLLKTTQRMFASYIAT